jgi:hypothetical protein
LITSIQLSAQWLLGYLRDIFSAADGRGVSRVLLRSDGMT